MRAIILALCLVTGVAVASETYTDEDVLSYSLGFQTGKSAKQQEMELNLDAFQQGLEDAMADKTSQIDPERQKAVITSFKQKVLQRMQAKQQEQAMSNLEKANAFLEENKSKDGITTTDSGLQYRVIKEGEGSSPTLQNSVVAHYKGTLIDGTEFDSSYKRGQPIEFPVTGVIKGWTEALQLMKPGAKWELFIPPALAYGERGAGALIPPNSALVFEVELVEVK